MGRRLLVIVFTFAMVLAACSSDSGEDVATDDTDESPTAEPDATDDGDVETTSDTDGTNAPSEGDGVGSTGDGDDTTGTSDDDAAAGPTPTPGDDVDLSQPAFTSGSKVSTVGLDEIFFGMSVADAAGAAGTAWAEPTGGGQLCYFVTPQNGPPGVSFLVWGGFVEAVFIETDLITTRSGAGVGSSEEELRSLFGEQLLVAPNPNGGGNWAQFVPLEEGDDEFRVVFETDGNRVTSYRSGRVPQVVDGCPG